MPWGCLPWLPSSSSTEPAGPRRLVRVDELKGDSDWHLLIARPGIDVEGTDLRVRVRTRTGVTYVSRANATFSGRPRVVSTILLEEHDRSRLRIRHKAPSPSGPQVPANVT